MKCFYTFLSLTFLCSGLVTGSQPKVVELVQSELHYCRYIAYQAKHDNIPKDDAIEWIDDIIEIAIDQLEEYDKQ